MVTVDQLKEIFGCKEDQELGKIFDRKKGAVSIWRKSGVPASIEREAVRLQMLAGGDGVSFGGTVPSELLDMVGKYKDLDPITRTMLVRVLDELKGLDQAEQWKKVSEFMAGLK